MKKLIIISIIATTLFAACKKSKTEPSPVGSWAGLFQPGDISYTLVINADGTTKVKGTGNGTWKLTGSTLTSTYSYPGNTTIYNTTGALNVDFNTMTGTWGTATSSNNGGTFVLTKQ